MAATISGVVYDLNLQEVTTAVVTISTSPEQRMVTRRDGIYEFQVTSGTYRLRAHALIAGAEWSAEENLTVPADGEYVRDLILQPSYPTDEDLDIGGAVPDVEDPPGQTGLRPVYLLALLLVPLAAGAAFLLRRRTHAGAPPPALDEDEYRAEVLRVLHESDGRATQKEIKRAVRFSEAKVSLILSELEYEGRVQKIKKGRGNIIILRRSPGPVFSSARVSPGKRP